MAVAPLRYKLFLIPLSVPLSQELFLHPLVSIYDFCQFSPKMAQSAKTMSVCRWPTEARPEPNSLNAVAEYLDKRIAGPGATAGNGGLGRGAWSLLNGHTPTTR